MTRIARLRELMDPGVSLVVTDLVNVRYLCGFTGSHGALVVGPTTSTLLTDSRYVVQANAQTVDVDIRACSNLLAEAHVMCRNEQVWVEAEHLSLAQAGALPGARHTTGLVEGLRLVKDQGEIDAIRTACQIATNAWREVVNGLRLGVTERDVAITLERAMVDAGAEDRGFNSIVAFGPHSAIPHHEPTSRPLQRGDLVKIDFGAKVDGYHSDCTRTVVAGSPAQWQVDMHAQTRQAQAAAIDQVRAGSALVDVDSAARNALADVPGAFEHGLGHGVGLRIHEDPFFRQSGHGRLAEGMVVTVEPGVYQPERGGVRIEDTFLVTGDGCHNLTDLPRELIDVL